MSRALRGTDLDRINRWKNVSVDGSTLMEDFTTPSGKRRVRRIATTHTLPRLPTERRVLSQAVAWRNPHVIQGAAVASALIAGRAPARRPGRGSRSPVQECLKSARAGRIDPVQARHPGRRERLVEAIAPTDDDGVIPPPAEFLDLLGDLLEEWVCDRARIVVGGKLDRSPFRLKKDWHCVEFSLRRVEIAVGDDRDAVRTPVAERHSPKKAWSRRFSARLSWPGSWCSIPMTRGAGMPLAFISLRSSSKKMPSPGTSSSLPSGQSGRPARFGSELVMHTPIVGLPSMPTSTTSRPSLTCCSMAPTTADTIRRQWRRNADVSYCSRTAQKRFNPVKVSSGHGICSIRQP